MSDRAATDRRPPEPALVEAVHGTANGGRLPRAAQAAHLLCDVLWEALHDELGVCPNGNGAPNLTSAPTERWAALAERIADVAATVALLARTDRGATVPPSPARAGAARAAVTAAYAPAQAQSEPALMYEAPRRPRPRPWDASSAEHSAAFHTAPQWEPLVEHGDEEPAAWTQVIASALEQFERDRRPFAVLLIEVANVEQLPRGVRIGELPHLMRAIDTACTRALETIGARSGAWLALEPPARLWLQVPELDRLGAHELAERLARASEQVGPVEGAADPAERYFAALSAHSAPPQGKRSDAQIKLGVGTAVCPEDGRDVAALVRHAKVELATMRSNQPQTVARPDPV